MNTWTFSGNITQDPALRKTASGKEVCNFSVAVNNYSKNDENEVIFVNVSAWDRLAQIAANLRKGTRVVVSGTVKPLNAYLKKADNSPAASMNVTANDIVFFNPNSSNGNFAGTGYGRSAQPSEPAQQDNGGFSGFDPTSNGWFG